MATKATNKKPLFGNLKSHSNRKTRHAQKPNIQKINIDGKSCLTTPRETKKIKKSN
ncbi:MAG: L28 family ribosomal protein [Bacilli bacterium]|nr:L28 family ribosomal protein [Bacilli bacterium]MDD4643911.1 L28 family ribosomal protein [Bacilli bacterium]